MDNIELAENKIITETDQKEEYLTFILGEETYGIDIEYITEIIRVQSITELPGLPSFIRGIMNLRGNIVPVMDVRLRFQESVQEYNDRTCIIVIDIKDISIGLIVDEVSDVVNIPGSEITETPDIEKDGDKYIKAIGKVGGEVKLLIDCEKLIYEHDMEANFS